MTTAPKNDKPPVVDLQQTLDEANAAQQRNDNNKALSLLSEAAQAHPGSKQPWLRTAQLQFEAMNYGAAIVAAQEVLQRDTSDLTARSIIAVSGLRASAAALAHLRQANSVNGSTRTEAEVLARTIREALGEPVLVPPPPGSRAGNSSQGGSTRRAPRAAPAAQPPVEAPPQQPASTGGRNPFGALQ
ncbi:tetratricopeptide repeat protein [Caldimonas brevitalea]|uniref:Tetratricopeptide repeat protein n=1 Tax=Caldimonas brevitalea TaxID=413882 RepID=A0A0G3BMG4_9BURK|nr:hypothetical protein [Caldimonas brevitalea]AKJ28551.1 hypothetical protein AAW51_1860 [Caldimonas brevitalea]